MNLEEYAKKIGNERFLSSDEIEVLLKTINTSNAFADKNGEIEQWDDRSRIVRGMIEAIHIIRDHISVYGTNNTSNDENKEILDFYMQKEESRKTLGDYAKIYGLKNGLSIEETKEMIDFIDSSHIFLDRDDEPHDWRKRFDINRRIVLGMSEAMSEMKKHIIKMQINEGLEEGIGAERIAKEKELAQLMEKEELAKGKDVREALAYSLGADLHETWRKGYAKNNTLEDGTIAPRMKKTKDQDWIAKNGTDTVDIANTAFAELPEDWQGENLKAAKVAIDLVYGKMMAGQELTEEVLQELSAIVHDKWLERNPWEKDGPLGVPYEKLEPIEKEKDTVQLRDAIKKVTAYQKGEINIEALREEYGLNGNTK